MVSGEYQPHDVDRALINLFDDAPVVAVTLDEQLRYVRVNREAAKIIGQAPERIVGAHVTEIAPPFVPGVADHYPEILTTGKQYVNIEAQGEIVWRPGVVRHWATSSFPLKGPRGRRWLGSIAIDITARKQVERIAHKEAEKAREESREAARANQRLDSLIKERSVFVSVAAHELRTPLSTIIAFIDTLLAKDIAVSEEDHDQYLGIIRDESLRLNSIINELLDITRIDIGKFPIEPKPIDINQTIAITLEQIRIPEDISFQTSFPSRPSPAFADERKIMQVMHNLLGNAINYTPAGGAITAAVERDGAEVVVSVTDTGPGIAPELHEKIFERFFRDKSVASRQKGTGLGLAISKEIIEAHAGVIGVSSAVGEGSRFWFRLPVNAEGDG